MKTNLNSDKFLVVLLFISTSFLACQKKSPEKTSDVKEGIKKNIDLAIDTIRNLAEADSLYALGEKYLPPKNLDSSISFHLQALKIREKLLKDDPALIDSYLNLGKLYIEDNKYEVADQYLEKARRAATHVENSSILSDIYYQLVVCKREMKDFPTAISLANRLLNSYKNETTFNRDGEVRVYSLLGGIYYEQKQFDKAIENWQMVIRITPPDQRERLAGLFYNASIAYNAIHLHEKSLEFVNRAIHQYLKWEGAESESLAGCFIWKAFVLLDMKKNDSVSFFLHTALRIRREVHGEKSSFTSGANYALAEFYSRMDQADSAAFYNHQSLVSLVKGFNNTDLSSNPSPELNEFNPDLVNGLVRKASALKKMAEKDSLKKDLLDLSLDTYLLADSIFTMYRGNLLYDDPIMEQMNNMPIPYSDIVNVAMRLFEWKKSMEYPEKVFSVMERSRAFVLQNALGKASKLGYTGMPDSLISREKRLNRLRAELLQKLNDPTASKPELDSLHETLIQTSDATVDLQQTMKETNLNYVALKYETLLPSGKELQEMASEENIVFVEYMWGGNKVYALRMSSDTISMKAIAVTDSFTIAFNEFMNEFHADPDGTINQERYRNFCHNSRFLYNSLFKDLLSGISTGVHVVISADGPLTNLPFEALISSDPKWSEVNYHLPYAVLEHPISYAYSAGVLLRQLSRERKGGKLLAFGYAGANASRNQNRSGLRDLPGTKEEVLAIKEVMKNHVNQYQLQEQASEFMFKKNVQDFDIIHLAVHGEADTLNTLNSRLIFRSEQDSIEDGSLYAHELYDLDLSRLDLAVLSACESGMGKRQTGEGVMSIARGFAYAGCPSLVISLWKIDDRTSAKVMKGFYKYLKDGKMVDVALAKAKTDYLTSASEFNAHPYYWAALLPVGNMHELDIRKPNWWSWVLGVAAISVLLLSLFRGSFHRKTRHAQ